MRSYTAAVIQMNSQPDRQHNFGQAASLINKASNAGAQFVSLPENFALLGDFDSRMQQADVISKEAEDFLQQAASEHSIYLLGGSFPVPAYEGKVLNRSLLLNPKGEVIGKYDKIHLFDVDLDDGESYRESDYVEPGKGKPVVVESKEIGNIGLSICYDLRFPELYRQLSSNGAQLLMVPSAFTQTTGRVHWEVLLRARAIENTCYVLAPAQTGRHGKKRQTYGHSMIIDPWEKILAEGGTEAQVIMAELDKQAINKARKSIPSLNHRRL